MLNKLLAFSREQQLFAPGDSVICALSGGADSVALLFSLYLLKDRLEISLSAAHFNHHLRGAESQRDEDFVRDLCQRYDIPLHLGSGQVLPGEKGLEAAAREARYAFLRALPGKIATAHTSDDNAETVLLHLVRGTGLRGLGGIAPKNGNVVRPMLTITRQEVEAFLTEWSLPHVEDSSNHTNDFLRNRLRRRVLPLLREENPSLSENISAMALRLRLDSEFLDDSVRALPITVATLQTLPPAQRSRCLERFLKESGVREPEAAHISLLEKLVFSQNPSARATFPGNIIIAREYDRLTVLSQAGIPSPALLSCPGSILWGDYRITCTPAEVIENTPNTFTLVPGGTVTVRSREAGDKLRLSGGSKSLKKLFIDRKLPAAVRPRIPVLADETGVLAVYSIGANLDRAASCLPAIRVHIEKTK